MNSAPLVSIVTPVYNGAEFLRECIESVLAQSYRNWQYLILNNCSTDDTLQIAQEYARKDARIRVESNESLLPIIANHNKAFARISPEAKYCKQVSADDWLFPECLEKMVALAEANPSVGIVNSYQLSGAGTQWTNWQVRWDEIPHTAGIIRGHEVCRQQLLTGVYVFGTPTSLLYRADLVRKKEEFFPNDSPHADTSACYQCLQESDFGFVHQVLSYERIHEKQASEESRNLNAFDAARLSDLMEYGPAFLTRSELERRKAEIVEHYYDFLAARSLRRPGRAFWKFHREKLAAVSGGLSPLRLSTALFRKIVDLAFNPKSSLEKAMR